MLSGWPCCLISFYQTALCSKCFPLPQLKETNRGRSRVCLFPVQCPGSTVVKSYSATTSSGRALEKQREQEETLESHKHMHRQATKKNKLPQPDLHRTRNGCLRDSVSSSTSRSHVCTRDQTALQQHNNKRKHLMNVEEICGSLIQANLIVFHTYSFPPWTSGGNCSNLQALGGSWSYVQDGSKTPHCPWNCGQNRLSAQQENSVIWRAALH